ncbi:hypothetical protein [Sphingomonas sp. R1]|uniref:hypothetical protein n=1 Tax=Sphingomonas sp. R1 TaxID=399176 RepID=UPI0022254E71|nr:hypothetical protein [Sphingomonas sp. R1]UYY77367.1 hypothetical protein OIM94_18030 [Sphingomonas sp. R1]
MAANDGGGGFDKAERIAGALVNDQRKWLPDEFVTAHYVDLLLQLGNDWTLAVMEVRFRNRNGLWDEEGSPTSTPE